MHYAIYLFTFIVECIWSHIENIKSKIKTNHNIDIWTPTMLRCMWLFGHWRANDKLHFPLSPLSMADRVDSEIILFLISFLDRHNGGSIVAWCMYVHLYASNRLCMARMCTYIYTQLNTNMVLRANKWLRNFCFGQVLKWMLQYRYRFSCEWDRERRQWKSQ